MAQEIIWEILSYWTNDNLLGLRSEDEWLCHDFCMAVPVFIRCWNFVKQQNPSIKILKSAALDDSNISWLKCLDDVPSRSPTYSKFQTSFSDFLGIPYQSVSNLLLGLPVQKRRFSTKTTVNTRLCWNWWNFVTLAGKLCRSYQRLSCNSFKSQVIPHMRPGLKIFANSMKFHPRQWKKLLGWEVHVRREDSNKTLTAQAGQDRHVILDGCILQDREDLHLATLKALCKFKTFVGRAIQLNDAISNTHSMTDVLGIPFRNKTRVFQATDHDSQRISRVSQLHPRLTGLRQYHLNPFGTIDGQK